MTSAVGVAKGATLRASETSQPDLKLSSKDSECVDFISCDLRGRGGTDGSSASARSGLTFGSGSRSDQAGGVKEETRTSCSAVAVTRRGGEEG